MKKIRLLLADDHPVYRDGLRMMLESHENLEVVAETGLGAEAITLAEECQADIALLDFNIPDIDGANVARALRKQQSSCAIIFLTMEKSRRVIQEAIDLNLDGYLLKDSRAPEIIEAILRISRGEKFFSPDLSSLVMAALQASQSLAAKQEGIDTLTPSEKKVLHLIASDRTSKEIAQDLGISTRTVEGHRANISKKLNLSGPNSLVKFAFKHRENL